LNDRAKLAVIGLGFTSIMGTLSEFDIVVPQIIFEVENCGSLVRGLMKCMEKT
jgi:hypothetical protein